MWTIIRAFLGTNGILSALLIGGGVMLFTYDKSRVDYGRAIESASREKANATAVKTAHRAGVKSRNDSGGVPSPYYRD